MTKLLENKKSGINTKLNFPDKNDTLDESMLRKFLCIKRANRSNVIEIFNKYLLIRMPEFF